MVSYNLYHFSYGFWAPKAQTPSNGNHIGEGVNQEDGMLRNLVPGSHLLLIWDVLGFIVCFQCPAGVQRWQGSRGSLPSPGTGAEAGRSSVVGPCSLQGAPGRSSAEEVGNPLLLVLACPHRARPAGDKTAKSGQPPTACGRLAPQASSRE